MKQFLYRAEDENRVLSLPEKISSIEESSYRTNFRKDYGRLIHSPAFRRLQGKTQLFPWAETDFFRNRLTHSLEVAQIAKMIAIKLNKTHPFFIQEGFQIDTDLVEFAGLAHDLGHPPFGHTGEHVLDNLMKQYGGFEGNAQTLRILAKIEKRQYNGGLLINSQGIDCRCGLNLTYRTLASILKYNHLIPETRNDNEGIVKGYYKNETDLVKNIVTSVTGIEGYNDEFKTIECQIMDVADDIAYSTYDLEDAFKAKFISPLDCLSISDELASRIAQKVFGNTGESDREKVRDILFRIFSKVCLPDLNENDYKLLCEICKPNKKGQYNTAEIEAFFSQKVSLAYNTSMEIVNDGYIRTNFTSELVGIFISGVSVEINQDIPALSKVFLEKETREKVEVLKHFAFNSLILTPRLNIVSKRGFEIVGKIFDSLNEHGGDGLLPDDHRNLYMQINKKEKSRIICDFIAGMTDRYAIEFYGRLTSENPETIFKPF